MVPEVHGCEAQGSLAQEVKNEPHPRLRATGRQEINPAGPLSHHCFSPQPPEFDQPGGWSAWQAGMGWGQGHIDPKMTSSGASFRRLRRQSACTECLLSAQQALSAVFHLRTLGGPLAGFPQATAGRQVRGYKVGVPMMTHQ